MVELFMVEKFTVEKFMFEKFMVEKSGFKKTEGFEPRDLIVWGYNVLQIL